MVSINTEFCSAIPHNAYTITLHPLTLAHDISRQGLSISSLAFFPKSIYKAQKALLTPCARRRPRIRTGGGGEGCGGPDRRWKGGEWRRGREVGTNIGTSTAKSTRVFERAGCLIRSQRRQSGSAEQRQERLRGREPRDRRPVATETYICMRTYSTGHIYRGDYLFCARRMFVLHVS